jgi:hypothetical protein
MVIPGRADGSGKVTTSQLFAFNGTAIDIPLTPDNDPTICMSIVNGLLDVGKCGPGEEVPLSTNNLTLEID